MHVRHTIALKLLADLSSRVQPRRLLEHAHERGFHDHFALRNLSVQGKPLQLECRHDTGEDEMPEANPTGNVGLIKIQEPRGNYVSAFPVTNADLWEDEPRILAAGFCIEGIMSMPGLSGASSLSLATVSWSLASISLTRWSGPASPKYAPSTKTWGRWRTQRLGLPTARLEPYRAQVDTLR